MSKRRKSLGPQQMQEPSRHESGKSSEDFSEVVVHLKLIRILVGIVFLLLLLAYIKIITLTALGPKFYNFDFVERFRVLGVDDIYRYYFAKSAWSNIDLYSWSYIQPVGLFLDGSTLKIIGKDVFSLRCVHAIVNLIGLFLLYKAGIRLGIRPLVMLFSMLVVALMPLYIFVSISFLGESWLLFFICLSVFLFSCGKWSACAMASSLLPLIRPEGMFVLIPLFLFFLHRRDIRNAVLLVAPGFSYFLYLFAALDFIGHYSEWRLSLRFLLDMVRNPLLYRFGMFSTFNPIWFVPAVCAFLLPRMRRMWPFCLGAALAMAWFMAFLSLRLANYEPRYLVFIVPICALGAGAFFQYLTELKIFSFQRKGLNFVFIVIFAVVIAENLLQIDWLRARYGNGERWPFSGISPRPISLEVYDNDRVERRIMLAEAIYDAVKDFPKIDTLLIYDPEVLLVLDPADFPRPLKVVLLQVDKISASRYGDDKMLGLFPWGRQYANFSVTPTDDVVLANGIYVGPMNCFSCKPLLYEGSGLPSYTVKYDQHDAAVKKSLLDWLPSGEQ